MEMALPMLLACTYLPGFVTMVFRGMPTVWRGRHRLIFCWLIFMQAVSPGRKPLEEMAVVQWGFYGPGMQSLNVWSVFIHLPYRHTPDRVSLLPKCFLYPTFKESG